MTNAKVLKLLSRYRAYKEVQEWAEAHGGPMEELWRDCERGDWMLWLAVRAKIGRRVVVNAACACARTALQYVPAGEERPRRAIETAEAWARGDENLEAVRAAATAAKRFGVSSASASAAFAAYAAAAAAYAFAASAASGAYAAATAAVYAADAAALAAANDDMEIARARVLAECAELVRAYISAADIETVALKGRTS